MAATMEYGEEVDTLVILGCGIGVQFTLILYKTAEASKRGEQQCADVIL